MVIQAGEMKSGLRGELGCGTSTFVEWYELHFECLMMNNSCAFSTVLTVPPQFCDNAYRRFLCFAGDFKRRRSNPDEKYMAHSHFPGMNHRSSTDRPENMWHFVVG